MSRPELRRVFTSQGSNPLEVLKVSGSGGGSSVRVEYDRSLRANALVMAGDVSQTRVQLPRDDKSRVPLSTSPILSLVLLLTNADFSCEVDVSANLSVVAVSANGAAVGQPSTRRVSQRISLATYHDAGAFRIDAGAPKGPCKAGLCVPRGQWSIVTCDLSLLIADYYSMVSAAEAGSSTNGTPTPLPMGRGVRPNPPNLFAKAPRFAVTVLTLNVDKILLCGAGRVKEVICLSDLVVADTIMRDLRLPMFVIPEQGNGLQPAPLRLAPQGTAGGSGPSPLRSIPVPHKDHEALSPPPAGPGVFQVRFTRNVDGKVGIAAKDLELERRRMEEEEALALQQELAKSRLQLEEVMAREEAANSYRRIVEPELAVTTDRFGVRLGGGDRPGGATNVGATRALEAQYGTDGGLGAWSEGGAAIAPPRPEPVAGRGKAPPVKPLAKKVPETRQRISYLPTRKPIFCSKVGEHVDVSPLPPAPSSLLLTSVMKRPLATNYPADDVRMVRTPPAGGGGSGAPLSNGVCTGRVLGYGVGCLDIIHFGSSDDDADDISEDDDGDSDDDDDSDEGDDDDGEA